MRKIKIETWQSRVPKFDDEGKAILGEFEEKDEDLLVAFNVLIANKKPENIPKGIDKFRLFGRLSKAFEKAEETRELILEESDYSFLKKTIEEDIPSTWGLNSDIMNAMEEFLDAKAEE